MNQIQMPLRLADWEGKSEENPPAPRNQKPPGKTVKKAEGQSENSNKNRPIHGDTKNGIKSAEWKIWTKIKGRCLTPTDKAYPSYGGRGITLCERWSLYINFLEDMGRRPSPDHSIDRVDNDGNYDPKNCRWATAKEQANNRRSNHIIEFGGERLSVSQWADRVGLKQLTLLARLRKGWTVKKSITQKLRTQ